MYRYCVIVLPYTTIGIVSTIPTTIPTINAVTTINVEYRGAKNKITIRIINATMAMATIRLNGSIVYYILFITYSTLFASNPPFDSRPKSA